MCCRWPLRIFFTLMDIAGINSQIILACNQPNSTTSRKQYLKTLSFQLFDDYLKYRSTINTLPRTLRQHIKRFVGPDVLQNRSENQPEMTRRRCAYCPRQIDRKYSTVCYSCRQNICPRHAASVCSSCSEERNEE